jgi:peptidyl-prolyl cis-trans isomerase C
MSRRPLLSAALAALSAACSTPESRAPSPPPPRPAPALEAFRSERPPATAIDSLPDPAAADPSAEPRAPEPAASEPASGTQSTAPADPAPAVEPAAEVLGWVAGAPIRAEDLVVEWSDVAAKELWLLVDRLVATRLALAESSRLGVRLEPEAVEARVGATRAKLEQELARSSPDVSLEEYIVRELGFEPERYLDRVRKGEIRQMLAERAVRASSLLEESVALRLIVVSDEAALAAVQAALQGGADFALVAREHSVDDTAASGGLVPFLVEQEHSPLARLAFQTPVGELGGPLTTADHVFLIKVEERRAPLAGDWIAIRAAVEASLAEHPVSDAEFLHWKLSMEKRYPIDMRPLIELLGARK